MKEKFELWIVNQFGEHVKNQLVDFHVEDGYHDSIVNAMWIGFNAGALMK